MEPPQTQSSTGKVVLAFVLKIFLALFIVLVVGALALVGLVFVVCSRH